MTAINDTLASDRDRDPDGADGAGGAYLDVEEIVGRAFPSASQT
ncbi:MAG: hypothetical protein ACLQDY_25640 [Streptosporangiaceae bacterium]